MIQRLPISDQLSLIHDPSRGEGKTVGMAKGLFLCYEDEVYDGESAGFGLPVWKTSRQTFFPTLVTARWLRRNVVEKVYRLDRVVRWNLLGIQTPRLFSAVLEKLTRVYMQQPGRQQFLLKVRNTLLVLLRMESAMMPGDSQGECRVLYEAEQGKVIVKVDGRSLRGNGDLILLNEVAGLSFRRLRIGRLTQEGNSIPAWRSCPFSTILENPATGVGFSISSAGLQTPLNWRLAGGREVGHGLNWAGLELTPDRQLFMYSVIFREM
ncbi:MAG: hypothetical protein EG828_04145 [Deltaproteobacteria bacterium]|nr:hypothetical protein [Deltaproteobacteria bacterium]